MLASKLLSACGGSETLYVDDVFSTWLYTGNGSTQTITNGIDLAGKGGLVWIKNRSTSARDNILVDATRGATNVLYSNATLAQSTVSNSVTSFNSNGFSIGALSDVNESTNGIVSWTFRKSPKFFDCVTFTTSSTTNTNQRISHSLGQTPGMIILKATSATSGWPVWHRSLTDQTSYYLLLNSTAAQANYGNCFGTSAPTSTDFGINTNFLGTNQAMVAYVLSHDTSAEGIIQCGSFTTDGSGNATVNLGWEPQFLQAKASSTTGAWFMFDQMRGWGMSSDENLLANSANAAITGAEYGNPTATGFYVTNYAASATYIYVAIRRPNKPPTTGTQVFVPAYPMDSIVPSHKTTFPVDLVIRKNLGGSSSTFVDRLRGPVNLDATTIAAEVGDSLGSNFAYMNGWGDNAFGLNTNAHAWLFRRAPGVFDVCAYTGTGSSRTVNHNLGVAPELMIVKRRSLSEDWYAWHAALGAGKFLYPNLTNATVTSANRFDTVPTATEFSAGSTLSSSSQTYIAYLWASMPGISKVGAYTGNGSSQTIDCGFTAGARFVLIKRTDSTGDWYVWDSVRGIVAANDPHLSLNTTASQVTTNDSIDPTNAGFVVNQVAATNVNVTGATYIYLAYA